MQVSNWRTSNFSRNWPPDPRGSHDARAVAAALQPNKRSTAEDSFFFFAPSRITAAGGYFQMSLTIHLDCPKTFSPQATHYVCETQICRSAGRGEETRNASGAQEHWRLEGGNNKPVDLPWQQRYVEMACQP